MSTAAEKVQTDNTAKGKTTFADVALVSELNDLGWKVEGSGKSWTAYAKDDTEHKAPIGPATSVKALASQVKIKLGIPLTPANGNGKAKGNGKASSGDKFELTNEGEKPKGGKTHKVNSQPILTGTENAVFADLESLAIAYRKTTMAVLELQSTQADQKKSLQPMLAKFKDELQKATDGNGNEEYFVVVEVDGILVDVVLGMKEVETVSTRKHSS